MKRFAGFLVLATLFGASWLPSAGYADTPDQSAGPPRKSFFPSFGSSPVPYYSGYATNPLAPGAGNDSSDGAMKPPASPNSGIRPVSASSPAVTAAQPLQGARPGKGAGAEVLPSTPPGDLPVPGGNAPGGAPRTPAGATGLSGEVKLGPAPLESTDLPYPINLATALRLADARPIVVTAAQATAWVAEAELQHAKVLWVPSFNAGSDYIRHDGFGPDFNRGLNTAARPLNQNVNFLYSGIGLTQDVAMADAIFQPLAARQVLNARRWNIQSAKNDALMTTANAYFTVHQARGQYAGMLDVVERGHKLVERITLLSQDLVPRVEIDRAKNLLAELEQRAASARQMWRVASADLTQVLRLDPRVVIVPQEHDHLQLTLIDPNRPLDELIPIGLTNRPELASQQALVQAVAQRIRREKGRILMPSIMLNGFQTPNELIEMGVQGIGATNKLNLWSLRDDFSPQAMWQFEGLGFGNLARIKEQRGEQSRTIVEQFRIQDGVAGDITRAQARLQSAAVRVVQAERATHEALITYEGNFRGLAQTKRFGNVLIQIYRPQEVDIALEHLSTAYDQYFATVADYNRAQFELFHALGYPAQEVSALRPAGEVEPTDTRRPAFLPPVGVGPPPASR